MTTTAPATSPQTTALTPHGMQLTREQVELLKRTVCKGATDDELSLFLNTSQRLGLDPFSKQIHAVKRWNSKAGREEMAIQVGIDGFRLTAQRSKEYEGQIGPQWCGADGKWVDIWLAKAPPSAARVGVWRTGFREPAWGVARWDSYKQTVKDGSLTRFWDRMGDLMLAKCAEALALRKAFPAELSGVYAPEEMAQADTYVPPEAHAGKPGVARPANTGTTEAAHDADGVVDEPKSTPPQRKRFFAIARQRFATDDAIKAYLKEKAGTEHTAEIPKSVMSVLIEETEKLPTIDAPEPGSEG